MTTVRSPRHMTHHSYLAGCKCSFYTNLVSSHILDFNINKNMIMNIKAGLMYGHRIKTGFNYFTHNLFWIDTIFIVHFSK